MKALFVIALSLVVFTGCDESDDSSKRSDSDNHKPLTYQRLERTLTLDSKIFIVNQDVNEQSISDLEKECSSAQSQGDDFATFDTNTAIACLTGDSASGVNSESPTTSYFPIDENTSSTQLNTVSVDFSALLDEQLLTEIITNHTNELDTEDSSIDGLSTAENFYSYDDSGKLLTTFKPVFGPSGFGRLQLEFEQPEQGREGIMFRGASSETGVSTQEHNYTYQYQDNDLKKVQQLLLTVKHSADDIPLPTGLTVKVITETWQENIKVSQQVEVYADVQDISDFKQQLADNVIMFADFSNEKRFEYDDNNQLSEIYDIAPDGSETLLHSYTYLANGNIESNSEFYGNGVLSQYIYDDSQRLSLFKQTVESDVRELLIFNIYNQELNAVISVKGVSVNESNVTDSNELPSISYGDQLPNVIYGDGPLAMRANFSVEIHFYQDVNECGDYELLVAQSPFEFIPRCRVKNDFPPTTELPYFH